MNREQLLLTQLSEECHETGQRATKAMRFGMDEIQEGHEESNRERLLMEFNDLVGVMEELFGVPVTALLDPAHIAEKKKKIEKYARYSEELGMVNLS